MSRKRRFFEPDGEEFLGFLGILFLFAVFADGLAVKIGQQRVDVRQGLRQFFQFRLELLLGEVTFLGEFVAVFRGALLRRF